MKKTFALILAASACLVSFSAGDAQAQEAVTTAPAVAAPAVAVPIVPPVVESADELALSIQRLHEAVTPSLVAVKFTYQGEISRRELVVPGVVIDAEGLVMVSLSYIPNAIPLDQLKDFKIVIPQRDKDDVEVAATLVSRDERTSYSFVRADEKRSWKPITFVNEPAKAGELVYSIGMLPEAAGYTTYMMSGRVATRLRGERPTALVLDGLAGIGGVVFDRKGQAIGLVIPDGIYPVLLLNDKRSAEEMISSHPTQFEDLANFQLSLTDPLPAGKPYPMPWLGVVQMSGVQKDVAEFFGLQDTPAIEVGDVIPGGAAEKAGLKREDKIVALNGKPLERGDVSEELPEILGRHIRQMKVGQEITLSVISRHDEKTPHEVKLKLGERPPLPSEAQRFWTDDLGFGVRTIVFIDTYVRRLSSDQPGVVVSVIKPQGAAQTGGLERDDLITEINGVKVTDLSQFKTEYQKVREASAKDPIKLVVLRDGKTQVIRLEPPQ